MIKILYLSRAIYSKLSRLISGGLIIRTVDQKPGLLRHSPMSPQACGSTARARFDHSAASTNRPRGGENPLTTGVKQAVPYRTGREVWYLSVSTE